MITNVIDTRWALLGLLLFAACSTQPLSMDAGTDAAVATGCNATDCAGGCASDEVCYGVLATDVGSPASYEPQCMRRCNTTDDCPSGARCIDDPSVWTAQSPLCMHPIADPHPCRIGVAGCKGRPDYCLDASTLAVQSFPPLFPVCAYEHVHCPAGCEDVPLEDGGVGGRCR
jgi:hypothetical protein